MSTKVLRIAVDFDEVLFELTRSLIIYLNGIYKTNVTYEGHFSFFLEDVWGIPIEEAKKHIDNFVHSEKHRLIAPVPHAKEVVKRLQGNHVLHIVTGRCLTHKPQTEILLGDHFAGAFGTHFFTNHFSDVHKDKTVSKADVCIENDMHVLIEDAPPHALGVAKCGIPVLLLDRPWNQGLEHAGIIRVRSWLEVEQEIEKLSKATP